MGKWKSLLVAGALSVPAVALALDVPPPPDPVSPPALETPPPPPAKTIVPVKATEGSPELPEPPPVAPPIPTEQPKIDAPTPAPNNYVPPALPPGRPIYAPTENLNPPRPLIPPGKDVVLPQPLPHERKVTVPDISDMPNVKYPGNHYAPSPLPPLPHGVTAPVPPYPVPPHHCPEGECYGGESGLFFIGEIMWLRPRRSDPFAIVQTENGVSVATALERDSDYGMGFRAGLGFLDASGYFLSGNFTYFDHRVSSNNFTNPGGANIVAIGPAGFFETSQAGDTLVDTWDFQFQTLDFMSGAVTHPGEAIEVHYSVGAKLAWIDQEYIAGVFPSGSLVPSGSTTYSLDLQAAGPRIGTECRILLPYAECLAVYGRAYGSLLLGRRTEEGIRYEGGTPVAAVVRSDNSIFPVIELAGGIECSLIEGRLIVGAGYEFNYWFELGSSVGSPADVSIDGVFIRATLLW